MLLVSVIPETVTDPYVLVGKMLVASVAKVVARLVAAAVLAAASDDEKYATVRTLTLPAVMLVISTSVALEAVIMDCL